MSLQKVGKRTFLCRPQTASPKILDSFDFHKSANVLAVPLRKSQIRNFLTVIP
jgi:hypothetical protein